MTSKHTRTHARSHARTHTGNSRICQLKVAHTYTHTHTHVTVLLYRLIAKPSSSDGSMKPLRTATFNFYFAFSWLAPLSHLRVRWKVATPIAELVGAAIAFMAVVAPIDPGSPGQKFTFEANRFLQNLCMHKYIESFMSE